MVITLDGIDRLYWGNPNFLVPNGELAAEACAVIREAMRKEYQIALRRVVMHQRERPQRLSREKTICWPGASVRTASCGTQPTISMTLPIARPTRS